MHRQLKELSSTTTDARPHTKTSHKARRLAKLSNEVYIIDDTKVYLLDTYLHQGEKIAIVSLTDDSGIFEISYDHLIPDHYRD